MVLACAVRHLETEGDLFLPTIVLRAVLPIRTGHKHQFVIVTGVEIAQIDLSREPADRVGQRGLDRFWVPRFVQVNGDATRGSRQRSSGCKSYCRHHSIDAVSRLSAVAATIGLITPRHFTLTQAVSLLAIARWIAPERSSRFATNAT